MEIAIETKKQDWVAFRFSELIRERGMRWRLAAWAFGPPVGFALMLLIASHATHGWAREFAIGLSILVPLLYVGGVYVQMKRKLVRQVELGIQNGTLVLGKTELSLSQEGATVTRGSDVTFKNWKEIKRVTANADYGFLFLGEDEVVIIPRRCFLDQNSFEMFVKSAVIFQWHGENAIKADAYAAAHPQRREPEELKQVVIPMSQG